MYKKWYYVADATIVLRDQPTKVVKRFRFVDIISSGKKDGFPVHDATTEVSRLYNKHHCEVGNDELVLVAIINQIDVSDEQVERMRILSQYTDKGFVIPL